MFQDLLPDVRADGVFGNDVYGRAQKILEVLLDRDDVEQAGVLSDHDEDVKVTIGLGLAAGISLMSVGCATGDGGLCRAGAITTPLTALLLAGGIWLMLDAGARAEVRRSIGATF